MRLPAPDILALEAVSARAWPAARAADLGDWRLYATDGYSGRINACWPLGDPGASFPDAIARVEQWYAGHSLPTVFKVVGSPDVTPGLAERLVRLGYRPRTETVMMVAPAVGRLDPEVTLSASLEAAFVAVFTAAAVDSGDARERLATLARVPHPRAFARVNLDGQPAAVGASGAEGEWAGIFSMRTDAAFRRRGLARRVLLALLDWAAGSGALRVWLQVEADNAGAIALYEAVGFEEAYRYSYWRR